VNMTPERLVAEWRATAVRLQEKACGHTDKYSLVLVSRWMTHALTLLQCADELEQSLNEKVK
jgi:hypothetical protein